MKKVFALFVVLAIVTALFVVPGTTSAAKPAGNLAGAHTYTWHLSNDVMPMPPYGYGDIPGSDTSSKLIVNQPNGNTEVTITGVMGGLAPNTTYTVYLSNPYTPYVFTGWDVTGVYPTTTTWGAISYAEVLTLVQSNTFITGTSLTLADGSSPWFIDSGFVTGTAVDFAGHFRTNLWQKLHMWGEIAADGSMSGYWADVDWNTRSGTWFTTGNAATRTHTGDDYWTGLFPGQEAFTFTTDAYGAGSWHMNLRNEDFAAVGTYGLSVWINGGSGTVLISDNFDVVVD